MPRRFQIDAAGALHHIIVRGIDRRKIFRDNSDCGNFLNRLGGILRDSQTLRFAWALMSNHFQLLLRNGLFPISYVKRKPGPNGPVEIKTAFQFPVGLRMQVAGAGSAPQKGDSTAAFILGKATHRKIQDPKQVAGER